MEEAPKGSVGSSFDAFLKEEGIYEEVVAAAKQRVIARIAKLQRSKRQR